MLAASLRDDGFIVDIAYSGKQGLEKIRDFAPEIVLQDIWMPGEMDGMATLAKMREKLPDVPVVMMSGRAGLSDAVRATKLGGAA